jgi:hypothetical protein
VGSTLAFASLYNHQGGGRPERHTAQEAALDALLKRLTFEGGSLSLEPAPFPLECQPPYRVVRDAMECVDTLGGEGRPYPALYPAEVLRRTASPPRPATSSWARPRASCGRSQSERPHEWRECVPHRGEPAPDPPDAERGRGRGHVASR